jgi:3-hexulose-6-phosphate synthase
MQLQVALDRMPLEDALRLAANIQVYADWIEVGTSLIKEFGIESVRRMRQTLPQAKLLADSKTNDEARYEFELCFVAGADCATVMGTAPNATLQTCMEVAHKQGKQVTIDLLETSAERQQELLVYREAIFGVHVSKDMQESGVATTVQMVSRLPNWATEYKVTLAGGIRLDDIPALGARLPTLTVIVGSAITGTRDPIAAARAFADALASYRQ